MLRRILAVLVKVESTQQKILAELAESNRLLREVVGEGRVTINVGPVTEQTTS